MGQEVAYKDDDENYAAVIDIAALQQRLSDVDEAILLAKRVQHREAELARIYTTLSDSMAPKPMQALPVSSITDYQQRHKCNASTPTATFDSSSSGMQPFLDNKWDDIKFYEKTWFKVSAVGLGISTALAVIAFIVMGIMNAISNAVTNVSDWWASSGETVLGALALIVVVILVLMFKGGGRGTLGGTWYYK